MEYTRNYLPVICFWNEHVAAPPYFIDIIRTDFKASHRSAMKIAHGTRSTRVFTPTRIHGNSWLIDHEYASIFKESPTTKMIASIGRARQDGNIMSILGARKTINVGSTDLGSWTTKPAFRRPETILEKDSLDVDTM